MLTTNEMIHIITLSLCITRYLILDALNIVYINASYFITRAEVAVGKTKPASCFNKLYYTMSFYKSICCIQHFRKFCCCFTSRMLNLDNYCFFKSTYNNCTLEIHIYIYIYIYIYVCVCVCILKIHSTTSCFHFKHTQLIMMHHADLIIQVGHLLHICYLILHY